LPSLRVDIAEMLFDILQKKTQKKAAKKKNEKKIVKIMLSQNLYSKRKKTIKRLSHISKMLFLQPL